MFSIYKPVYMANIYIYIVTLCYYYKLTFLNTRSMGQPQLISTKSTSVWVDNNSAHRIIVSGNEPQICRKDTYA